MVSCVTDTSVRISDSYIGQRYGDQKGLFLGYFDLEDEKDKKPIFVLKLTKAMSFNQTVVETGKLEDGYRADAHTYNAKQGLREGKTVIATVDIIAEAYNNKDKGAFVKMFKNMRLVLSGSSRPRHPHIVRVAGFRDGHGYWYLKGGSSAPSLLVRAGLNLQALKN